MLKDALLKIYRPLAVRVRPPSRTPARTMIIFDLACNQDHRFEGWFRSADDYASQQDRQLISCPQCNSQAVRRIPSVVAISAHRPSPSLGSPARDPGHPGMALLPAGTQVMAMYRQFVQTMIADSDNVGAGFADEARKIHYREVPERSICGNASQEECEALVDEGIAILRLPSIKEEDLN